MNLWKIDNMVRGDARAEEIMTYMVLSRGVNRRGDMRISTHGANSVTKRTGMSYRKAEAALHWLLENEYIQKPEGIEYLGKGKNRVHQARWILLGTEVAQDIYLGHSLIEGVGRGKDNPPLKRIYSEATNNGGVFSEARLDALMVLLHLYRHQDIEACGGVDPRAGIYRTWVGTENSNGIAVQDIGTNHALYEIAGTTQHMFHAFAKEALFYVDDQNERHTRFWDAFNNLQQLGFLYEVTQIWSANPHGEDGRKAEPLYTLYIHDRHARESEPYLQSEIHRVAFKYGAMDTYVEFQGYVPGEKGPEGSNIGSGQFRYIGKKKQPGFPIGIYRLRFRPNTRDTGAGIAAE